MLNSNKTRKYSKDFYRQFQRRERKFCLNERDVRPLKLHRFLKIVASCEMNALLDISRENKTLNRFVTG